MKREKFVQLGKRINGKIVKNEQYGVEEFCELVFPKKEPKWIIYNNLQRLFNTKKYKEAVKQYEEWKLNTSANVILKNKITQLIGKDVKGKGSWRK